MAATTTTTGVDLVASPVNLRGCRQMTIFVVGVVECAAVVAAVARGVGGQISKASTATGGGGRTATTTMATTVAVERRMLAVMMASPWCEPITSLSSFLFFGMFFGGNRKKHF